MNKTYADQLQQLMTNYESAKKRTNYAIQTLHRQYDHLRDPTDLPDFYANSTLRNSYDPHFYSSVIRPVIQQKTACDGRFPESIVENRWEMCNGNAATNFYRTELSRPLLRAAGSLSVDNSRFPSSSSVPITYYSTSQSRYSVQPLPHYDCHDEEWQLFVHDLNSHSLQLESVEGDGNCVFRALSRMHFQTERYHAALREELASFIRQNPEYITSDDNRVHLLDKDVMTVEDYVQFFRTPKNYVGVEAIVAFTRIYGYSAIYIFQPHGVVKVEGCSRGDIGYLAYDKTSQHYYCVRSSGIVDIPMLQGILRSRAIR